MATDDVERLLSRAASHDALAVDRLVPLLYAELHGLAQAVLRGERVHHTLSATALVHEAYLKLVGQRTASFEGRAHFLATAAQAMRRVLVDHARARGRIKRGGGIQSLAIETDLFPDERRAVDVLSLDGALERLRERSPDATRVVELRYFGGLTIRETAAVMEVSETTVEREWRYAKAWLYRALASDGGEGGAAPQ